jgi:hypothetical protein
MIKEFYKDHDNPKDSQVIICLTGTPEFIAEKLLEMYNQCTIGYGKPIQGQIWSSGGSSEVATPKWKGITY